MKAKMLVLAVTFLLLVGYVWAGGQEEGVDEDQVVLEFMGWEASPLETESVEQGLARFMEENPGVRVEYTPVAGDYEARLLTLMAGDAAPDVFFIGNDGYRPFAERGQLLDITDRFNESFDIEEFIPLVQDKMLVNGDTIYGMSSSNAAPVLYYNKDIFDEAGVAYPPSNPEEAWTWDEFLAVAEELTTEDTYGTFGFDSHGWNWGWPPMVYSNGGTVFNDDYTEFLLDSPEAREALEQIRDLRVEYGYAPEGGFEENVGMNPAQMLQTGMIATMVDGTWALQELAAMDFPVGVGVLPQHERPVTQGQAHLHAAYAETEHPDEAWELIRFLSGREYQMQLIRPGLWTPNFEDLLTPEGSQQWSTEGVHPDGYEELLPYFTDYAEPFHGIFVGSEVNTIIADELDRFWYDGASLDAVLPDIERQVNPLIQQ